MPDDLPRHGTSARHAKHATRDPGTRQAQRRRRSMEDSGGLSVSDLVSRNAEGTEGGPYRRNAAAQPRSAPQRTVRPTAQPQRDAERTSLIVPLPERVAERPAEADQARAGGSSGRALAPRPVEPSPSTPAPDTRQSRRPRSASAASSRTESRRVGAPDPQRPAPPTPGPNLPPQRPAVRQSPAQLPAQRDPDDSGPLYTPQQRLPSTPGGPREQRHATPRAAEQLAPRLPHTGEP
ncbi:MAG: hypothetical protein ACRDQ1_06725, partial [Sciscionella sp.]